jgi:hypothetical protein
MNNNLDIVSILEAIIEDDKEVMDSPFYTNCPHDVDIDVFRKTILDEVKRLKNLEINEFKLKNVSFPFIINKLFNFPTEGLSEREKSETEFFNYRNNGGSGCISIKYCDKCQISYSEGPCVCGKLNCNKCGGRLYCTRNKDLTYMDSK